MGQVERAEAAGASMGSPMVCTRYLSAQLDGGGDICDVIRTPFGLRVLVGDVMGTGADASNAGNELVAAWRVIAAVEPSLAGVAVRLHRLVAGSPDPDRFVTAFLVNFDGSPWAEYVCCGHPPPLLLSGFTATYVDVCQAAPPLGLLDMAEGWCSPGTFRFGAADRLLLYTDGVTEARDCRGDFFPLAGHAARALRTGCDDDEALLDALLAALRGHVGEDTSASAPDDVLLMLVNAQATLCGGQAFVTDT
jgi:serine phosphatase RsbU (regulator of sigma subunit)